MPCGSSDRNVIMASPMLRDQNEIFRSFSFQKAGLVRPRILTTESILTATARNLEKSVVPQQLPVFQNVDLHQL
jgi:hypothetical protein